MTSPACRRQDCDGCNVFGCAHTCHSMLDDPGEPITPSFNGYGDELAAENNVDEILGEDVSEE